MKTVCSFFGPLGNTASEQHRATPQQPVIDVAFCNC